MDPGKVIILIMLITIPFSSFASVAEAEGGFPLTVIDDFGRNVTILSPPERIVSTAPSNTEILFALDLGEKVVGVTQYCNWPPIVLEKVRLGQITVIGGYANPSLEGVVSLSPDLVLAATDIQLEFVSALQNRGVVVLGLNPKTFDDVLRDLALVGTVCGKTSEANRLIQNLQLRSNYISNRIAGTSLRPRVYYELWYDPMMSFGSNTLFDELVTEAGGENIFHEAPAMYPIVNSEMVIQKDPDIIIVAEGYMGGVAESEFEKRAGWSLITAVKEGEIYTIDENLLIRPGPRICEGLETIASILHPQLFTGTIRYNSSIAVTSNSTVFAVIYDDGKSLLNFSIIGREGTVASVRVNIEKKFLKGSPVVLVDGIEKAVSISEDQEEYTVEFTTSSSTHHIVVGGSQTIPEFSQHNITMTLLFALAAVFIITIFHRGRCRPQGSRRGLRLLTVNE